MAGEAVELLERTAVLPFDSARRTPSRVEGWGRAPRGGRNETDVAKIARQAANIIWQSGSARSAGSQTPGETTRGMVPPSDAAARSTS